MIELLYIIIFISYILLILLTMLFFSSYLAAFIMLFVPVVVLIVKPDFGIEFLTYEQGEFLNGMLTINNLHILLLIWSALLSIIIYTEFLSWYISRGTQKQETKKPEPNKPEPEKEIIKAGSDESPDKPKEKTENKPGQVNIPFKPLERFLLKLESLIGGKK